MKRALLLAMMLALVWGIVQAADLSLYNQITWTVTATDQPGSWITRNTTGLLGPCWYDSVAAYDTTYDTLFTAWMQLGRPFGYHLDRFLYMFDCIQLDTCANIDSADGWKLYLQTSADTNDANVTSIHPIYTTFQTDTATKLMYYAPDSVYGAGANPMYGQWARTYLITVAVGDSNRYHWEANCAGYDTVARHLPYLIKEYYYPIFTK